MPSLSRPKPAAAVGVTPPRVNAAGQTQLWIATSVGDVAKVCSLLAASEGALLVDLQDKDGASPLHVACLFDHMEVVHSLLAAGAKVNLKTNDGVSPLHLACEHGHVEVVCALLSEGAMELQTTDGLTPLHAACIKGHAEVVRTLLSAGAQVDLQSKSVTPVCGMPGRPNRGGAHSAISWNPR